MVNNIITVKEENIKNLTTVECKLPISATEAESVINLSSSAEIISALVSDGFITYNGKAVFTLLYLENGALKKCEHGVEFSYKIEAKTVKNDTIVRLFAKTGGEKVSSANGIVTVSAIVTAYGVAVNNATVETQFNIDGFLCKKEEIKTYKEVLSVVKSVAIEDEFELNYAVKDVIYHDERVICKEAQSGIGAVTVDGEIEITAYLTKLDGDEIVKERKTIPFSVEIENDEIYPACNPYAEVSVKNAYLKAYVDEGKNKSDFSIQVNLGVAVVCVENVTYDVVVDAYSPLQEIKCVKNEVDCCEFLRFYCTETQINGDINYEIAKNDRLIAVVGVKIDNEEYNYAQNLLSASGIVSAVAVLNTENGVKKVELSCPYATSLRLEGNAYSNANATVRNFEVRLTPSGFAYSYSLIVTVKDLFCKKIKGVSNVEVVGEKQANTSAISVFFGSNGETVWDACKALGVSEEEIARFNENLPTEFTGDERIVVFREEK